MNKRWTLPLLLSLLFLQTPVVSGQEKALARGQEERQAQGWAINLGIYDTADNPLSETDLDSAQAGEGTVEYRLKPFVIKNVPIIPAIGFSATTDGSVWLYGSFRYDWQFASGWYLTPTTGVSLYEEGDGKDLGGVIEFRSGLEISHRLRNGSRVGLFFYHLSNADIYDENPGNNSLVLTWSFGSL